MRERPTKVVIVANQEVPLIDNGNVPVVFADLAVEVRFAEGNVYLALASSSIDGKGSPEADLCSRVRMPRALWETLKRNIDDLIAADAKLRTAN